LLIIVISADCWCSPSVKLSSNIVLQFAFCSFTTT